MRGIAQFFRSNQLLIQSAQLRRKVLSVALRNGARVGAAAFGLGLSLAGPQAVWGGRR